MVRCKLCGWVETYAEVARHVEDDHGRSDVAEWIEYPYDDAPRRRE